MTAKEHIDKTTKMMIVERNRTDYARSHGDTEHVHIDEAHVILELPTAYALDLAASLRRMLAAGGDALEQALIAVDVPMRLYLRPLQVEQLVEKLAEISK